jgi:hypothetical protein
MSLRDGAVERNQVMPAMTSAGAQVDDDADDNWVVLAIASRFHLPRSIARVIVDCAGLGAEAD